MRNKKNSATFLIATGVLLAGAVSSCNEQDLVQPTTKAVAGPTASNRVVESEEITVKRNRQSALIFAEILSRHPRATSQIYKIIKERYNEQSIDEIVLFSELETLVIEDVEDRFYDEPFSTLFDELAKSHDYYGSWDYLDPLYDNTYAVQSANNTGIYVPYSENSFDYYLSSSWQQPESLVRPYIGYASPANEASGTTEAFSWNDKQADEPRHQTSIFSEEVAATTATWIIQQAGTSDVKAITSYRNGNRMASPQAITTVQVGWVKLTKDLDRWISFSGNGGGSELRFIRPDVSAKVDPATGVVTAGNNGFPIISVDIKRKDINKKNFVKVYSYWDFDWAESKKSQYFAVYEDDENGEKTINMSTKITVPLGTSGSTPSSNGTGEIGYTYSYKAVTKDDIIYQNEIPRESFLQNNTFDRGHGTKDGFQVYSGGNFLYFTLPNQ